MKSDLECNCFYFVLSGFDKLINKKKNNTVQFKKIIEKEKKRNTQVVK